MPMRILIRKSRSINGAIAWAFVLILIATVMTRPALALDKPDCDAYAAWAMTLDKNNKWQLNSANDRLRLPAAFNSPDVEALFGKPALDWSQDDVKEAIGLAQSCGKEARKAKRKQENRAFRTIRRTIHNNLNGILKRSATIRQYLEQYWADLNAVPASREKLLAFAALRHMSAGGGLEPEHWRVISGSREPAYQAAVGVVTSLRDLPDADTEPLRPEIDARFDALRAPVVAAVRDELNTSPATLDGLKDLHANLASTKEALAPALTESDLAAIDAAAAERSRTIEETLLAEQIAALEATPESLAGLNAVGAALDGPVAAALTGPRLDTLRQTAADRRRAIGAALVAAETAKLADIPATLDGLRMLKNLENQVVGQLDGAGIGPPLARFKDAVGERFAVLGRDALPDFKQALADMPEDEDGLKDLKRFSNRQAAVVKSIPASLQQQYKAAFNQRQKELTEAIARENARLAALPLAGGVFAEDRGPRLEFSENKNNVYMHMRGDVTVAGEYETDGDRVIVKLPQANMVFQRDGAWLKGNGLELKRQPES